MNTAIALPRISFILPSLVGVMDIAKRAEEKLGYTALTERLNDAKLLMNLAKHDALPFVPKAVREYQRAQLWKARGFNLNPFTRYKMGWRAASISRYAGMIPIEILGKATALIEDLGDYKNPNRVNVNMEVVYLADHEIVKPVPVDPFIRVRAREADRTSVDKNPNPWHYIAVWDEPDFKF